MNLPRLGGAALLVGSVASICALALGLGVDENTGNVAATASLIQAFAGVVVLLGLPVLLAVGVNRGQVFTLLGYAGLFAVIAFYSMFLHLVFVLVLPWLEAQGALAAGPPPAIGTAIFAAGVVQILSTGLLGAGVLRAGVYSRWVGGLLLMSALLAVTAAALPLELVRVAAAAALFAGLALVGVRHAARTTPTSSTAATPTVAR